jgi:hypothetical protein
LILLEKSLRAARLKPISFSLGITAVQEAKDAAADGLLTLSLSEASVELQVSIKGGVAALRTLEGAYETEGTEKRVDADVITREVRITLGQLPKDLRGLVNRIRVFGRPELTEPLVRQITPFAREMGLLLDIGLAPKVHGLNGEANNQSNLLAALGLAVRHLAGTPSEFEFLPPKQHPLAQALARFSSRKIAYAGGAVGSVALVVGALFAWQQWTLSAQESRWRTMRPRVEAIDALQQQTRKFRPWYDESVRSLRILRQLTEAFPDDGSVTAKTLEVKNLTEISCSGQARDMEALLQLQTRLRAASQITDLQVRDKRGTSPVLFNLTCRWSEGGQP